MNVKVIVFDLDDTLYNEIEYVKSGFSEVSKFFADKYDLNEEDFFDIMMENLNRYGRGKVFDNALSHFNISNRSNIKKSISIYRTHIPNIKLPQESKSVIEHYKTLDTPMYIITDGNKTVQYNKVKALNIEKDFSKVFITHRYGIRFSKPSPYCFEKISKIEKVSYEDIVYIGDNINKDFIGIKPLGIRTIRIKNGMFKDTVLSQKHHAEVDIGNLSEIRNILKIKGKKNEEK